MAPASKKMKQKATPETVASSEGFATVEQAAKFLSVSEPTIYRMLKDEELPSILVRRSRRIPWGALRSLEK